MKRLFKKTFSYLLCSLLFCSLTGCQKYYLSLSNQKINVHSLASTYVHTPDKRQHSPPNGEMIVVDWRVPKEVLDKKPVIDLYVIYGDYTEKRFEYPIYKRMGYKTYKLINDEFLSSKGIITYCADLRLDDGEIYRSWKHQLWVNLITVEDDEPVIETEESLDQSLIEEQQDSSLDSL
ncbi:MAG: hypothetical protein NT065_03495 [Chlamydiae bacterium]|nr:hypothetical protein [Chlamydiota bacterium]